MNAGCANLATLKRHLLPETWETETTLDALLLDLGRGVAGQMEDWCSRRFARVAGGQEEFTGESQLLQLARFPLEVVTSIELKSQGSAVWEVQSDTLDNVSPQAGLLYFTAALGTKRDRVRVTTTAGFWWDQAEPEATPDVMPAGATALPASLLFAWLLQCQHIFAARELLGVKTLPSSKAAEPGAGIDLLATVKDTLASYRVVAH